jgi:hypothetical protein
MTDDRSTFIEVILTDDETAEADKIGRDRWVHSKAAEEAHEAGEEERALELWKAELQRDPGSFPGIARDTRPPWQVAEDERLQEEIAENWHYEEPTKPGQSGWVKNDDGKRATD